MTMVEWDQDFREPSGYVHERNPLIELRRKLGLSDTDGAIFQVHRVGYPGWFDATIVSLPPAQMYEQGEVRLRVYPPQGQASRDNFGTDYTLVGEYLPRLCGLVDKYAPQHKFVQWAARLFKLDYGTTFLFKKIDQKGKVRYVVRPCFAEYNRD